MTTLCTWDTKGAKEYSESNALEDSMIDRDKVEHWVEELLLEVIARQKNQHLTAMVNRCDSGKDRL